MFWQPKNNTVRPILDSAYKKTNGNLTPEARFDSVSWLNEIILLLLCSNGTRPCRVHYRCTFSSARICAAKILETGRYPCPGPRVLTVWPRPRANGNSARYGLIKKKKYLYAYYMDKGDIILWRRCDRIITFGRTCTSCRLCSRPTSNWNRRRNALLLCRLNDKRNQTVLVNYQTDRNAVTF